MNKIQLNLSDFFQDYRSKSCVIINKNWTSIKDLENHIRAIFRLSKHIYLTTIADVYLPSVESIDLIQDENCVIVRKQASSATEINEIPNNCDDLMDTSTNLENVGTSEKRKRKRKRKSKTSEKQPIESPQRDVVPRKKPKKSDKPINGSVSHCHFRFSDKEEDEETSAPPSALDQPKRNIPSSFLLVPPKLPVTARVIKAERVNPECDQESAPSNYSSKTTILPYLMSQIDTLGLDDVSELPQINDTIVFKIKHNAEITPYMMGTIREENGSVLKISLLTGEEHISFIEPLEGIYSFNWGDMVSVKKYNIIK